MCVAGPPEEQKRWALQQTAKKRESGSLEGRAPWEPGLGRGARGLPALVNAPSRPVKPFGSNHLTEALAGESSGPSPPLLSVPPKAPQGSIWAVLAQVPSCHWETLGGAPKVTWSNVHKEEPQWWCGASSLSSRPAGKPSSPPPRSREQKLILCLGQQESRSAPLPFRLASLSAGPLLIHLALPIRGTSGKHQTKRHQVRPSSSWTEERSPCPQA